MRVGYGLRWAHDFRFPSSIRVGLPTLIVLDSVDSPPSIGQHFVSQYFSRHMSQHLKNRILIPSHQCHCPVRTRSLPIGNGSVLELQL